MSERDRGSRGRGEREALVEAATTAWRPRGPSAAPRAHPAWADLDPAARVLVHQLTRELRALEAALDPDGLSTTARAVLARIRA